MKKRITMQDIAETLGVSKVAVSRAINNKDDISEELKMKILEKADELGYRYPIDNEKENKQLYNIGILSSEKFFDEEQSYYAKLLSEISKSSSNNGYTTTFNTITVQDERDLVLPRMCVDRKIDGLIVLGQLNDEYLEKLAVINLPLIFLDFYNYDFDYDSINIDNVKYGYLLTKHLIDLGHKKIAYVGSISGTSSIQDRYLGYIKALIHNGIIQRPDYLIEDRDLDGKQITYELPKDMPTAFVCNCDKVALHLVQNLEKLGYHIPQDISVVGFDNTVHSQIITPKITTIQIDLEAMVDKAIRIMATKINNPYKKYGKVYIDADIIHRESVDKVKK